MIAHLPGVTYAPLPKGLGPELIAPRLIVVHDTGNTASAAQEASYAHTRSDVRSRWTSAHFYADTSGVLGSCPLDVRAWAVPPLNGASWSIELCGKNGSLPGITLARGAALVAKLCRLGGIPIRHVTGSALHDEAGITGHADVNAVFHESTHTDPGPTFNWSLFLDAVAAAASIPATVRRGSTGTAVRKAQYALNLTGAGLHIDGVFGPLTEAAVRHYQQAVGITVDGVVGPVTWSHLLYM